MAPRSAPLICALFFALLSLRPMAGFCSEVTFEKAEAGVGQVRALKGVRVLPEDGSLIEEEFEYSTGIRLDSGIVLTTHHSLRVGDGLTSRVEFWHHGERHYRSCRSLLLIPDRDVAVLHCPGAKAGTFSLPVDRPPKAGDYAYIVGYPSYSFPKPRMLLSRGQILDLSYSLPGAGQLPERKGLMRLDAPVYSGQSGGAVFDENLQLIAMVTKANQTGKGNWDGDTFAVSGLELGAIISRAKKGLGIAKGYDFLEPQ